MLYYIFNDQKKRYDLNREMLALVPEFDMLMLDKESGDVAMKLVLAMYDSKSPYIFLEEKDRFEVVNIDLLGTIENPFVKNVVFKAACDKAIAMFYDAEIEQYREYEYSIKKQTSELNKINKKIELEETDFRSIERITKSLAYMNKAKNDLHVHLKRRGEEGDLGKVDVKGIGGKALSWLEQVDAGLIDLEKVM